MMAVATARDRVRKEMETNIYVSQCMGTCMARGLPFDDACIILAAYFIDRCYAMEETLHHNAKGLMRMSVIINKYEQQEKARV